MSLTLHYDFASDKSLAARKGPTLSITRATNGTYRDSSGTIQTAGSGVARFDHDAGGNSLGLLVEEARTNICLQSEDFSTTWGNVNSAETVNQIAAPDGSITADLIADDNSAGSGTIRVRQGITELTTSAAYTASVFAKKGSEDWVAIDIAGNASQSIRVYADLTNGVLGATTGADNVSEGIDDYGNGWYRVWVSYVQDSSDSTINFDVYLAEGNGDLNFDTFDGTHNLYLWGAQLEAAAFPSSYISTTTASVTRNADVVSAADVTWLDASAGSFYVKAQAANVVAKDQPMLEVSDASISDRIQLLSAITDGSFDVETFTTVGTDGAIAGTQDFSAATVSQAVAGYANNDIIAYLDGTSGGTEASATLPPSVSLTTLTVGSNQDGEYWNGHIAEIRYWDERWPDNVLEEISNGDFSSTESSSLQERRRHIIKRRRANAALARPRKELWAGRPVNNPKYR